MKRLFFIVLLLLVVYGVFKTNTQEIIIPSTSIRLRVIPNSNQPLDINIKEQVKTYLEQDVYTILKNTSDIETARKTINENLPKIKTTIYEIFSNNNYQQSYKVNFGNNYFPEKNYKGITYPAGEYESLVITIGAGEGDNWWCVLFPNFCLADISEDVQYKSYIYELMNKLF